MKLFKLHLQKNFFEISQSKRFIVAVFFFFPGFKHEFRKNQTTKYFKIHYQP